MDKDYKKLLQKQSYEFLGEHSALKVCTWTKKSITGEGTCYKEKFYGIKAHLCAQISTTVNFCDMDCIFCWRERHNSPFGKIDEPKDILKNIPAAQKRMTSGLGGHKNVDQTLWKEANQPKHIAISLTGETLYYPKLNEFIKEAHNQNYTTFIVSNGQLPEVLEKLEQPTQLYLSLDAPNETLFKKIDKPMRKNAWERLMKSLSLLKNFKRTCIRATLIRHYNMTKPEQWAQILEDSNPMFIEVKGFMLLGASRNKLTMDNMPYHEEVRDFAKQITEHCDYKIIDEQPESRVVLLMKKDINRKLQL